MEMLTKIAPNSTFSFVVSDDYKEGVRIDKYIVQQLPLYSRSFFQQLIDDEYVMLNGGVVSKKNLIIKPFDKVTLTFPPKRKLQESVISQTIAEKYLDVQIVAEEEHFLIVYKPADLLVHSPSSHSKAVTLVDWLLMKYKELADIGDIDRPAIIHRLDKDTSGLLIIPRTVYAHSVFGNMFRNRTVKKVYHAIVHGNPPAFGSIDLAIGRDPFNKKKMAPFVLPEQCTKINVSNNGKTKIHSSSKINVSGKKIRPSLTHYRVLEYFENYALVEVQLITGRMHQIRVHLAAIGHPVVGDPVYGVKSKLIKRQALHAHSLSFTFDNKDYFFSKDVPEDFLRLLSHLRNLS